MKTAGTTLWTPLAPVGQVPLVDGPVQALAIYFPGGQDSLAPTRSAR